MSKLIPTVACVASALLAMAAGSAQAMTLEQAFQAALQNDPQYRMSFFENEAGKEYRIAGRAGLLPQVQASWGASRNIVDQTLHLGVIDQLTHPRYISRSTTVQVRQVLFSLDAYARYKQGLAQTKEAAARFDVGSADVIVRTVSAYSDAMFAKDQLKMAEAQRDALVENSKVAKWLLEKGEGTNTDVLEVQARLDLAEAQVLEAQDGVKTTLDTLEGVVGAPVDGVENLSEHFRVEPEVKSFEEWRQIAMETNPEIQAFRLAVEVQQQEVSKARAAYTPRLDFIGTYSNADADSISTYQQSTVNRAVGVQLTVPLYSGGQVSAASRQSVANRERARAELDLHINKVMVDLRKSYSSVLSSASKVDALERAVESGKLLMTATEQSIKGGVRINLDLLNAQHQMVTSERDLAQARYNYLLSLIRMKQAAGTLTAADVHDMGRFFR